MQQISSSPYGFTLCTVAGTHGAQVKTLVFKHGQLYSEQPFDKGFKFRFWRRRWKTPSDMNDGLREISQDPRSGVLRGEPLSHIADGGLGFRRFADPDPSTNALMSADRAWVAHDVDSAEVPAGLGDPHRFLEGAAWVRDNAFPPEFRGAPMVATATAKSGLMGSTTWRGRLWHFLDAPIPDRELATWARGFAAVSGVGLDNCLLTPNQPHFVARPYFVGIERDPIPAAQRVALIPGDAPVGVKINVDAFAGVIAEIDSFERSAARTCGSDWRALAYEIIGRTITHAETGLELRQFRQPCESVIATAVRAGAALEDVQAVIAERLAAAGVPNRYGPRWVTQAFNSFHRRTAKSQQRAAAAAAELNKIYGVHSDD